MLHTKYMYLLLARTFGVSWCFCTSSFLDHVGFLTLEYPEMEVQLYKNGGVHLDGMQFLLHPGSPE